jgi:hypothetical protein
MSNPKDQLNSSHLADGELSTPGQTAYIYRAPYITFHPRLHPGSPSRNVLPHRTLRVDTLVNWSQVEHAADPSPSTTRLASVTRQSSPFTRLHLRFVTAFHNREQHGYQRLQNEESCGYTRELRYAAEKKSCETGTEERGETEHSRVSRTQAIAFSLHYCTPIHLAGR